MPKKTLSKKSKSSLQTKLRTNVEARGYHVVRVEAVEDVSPPWVYTVGLASTRGRSELALFGLNADLEFMDRVISRAADRVIAGEPFSHGEDKEGLLDGFTCSLVRLPKAATVQHLPAALAFFDGKAPKALQIVWPDPKKRLPWDPKVMLPVLACQPVFLRPDAPSRDRAFPFSDAESRLVYTTVQVATGKQPVRFAGRFAQNGAWQLTCGTTDDPDDLVMATLGWAFDRDPGLASIAKLRPGECAERADASAPWKRDRMPTEDA